MTLLFSLGTQSLHKSIYLSVLDSSHVFSDFRVRTALTIMEKDWDAEKQRPMNIYLKRHKAINRVLDRLKVEVTAFINKKKEQLSTIALSRLITRVCQSQQELTYPEGSLLHFTEDYIASRRDMLQTSTYKRYKLFLHLLARFEGHLGRSIPVHEMGSNLVKEFLAFGNNECYCPNTLHRTINFVKTVLNYAERMGVTTRIREIDLRTEKRTASVKEVLTLSEGELAMISKVEVPADLRIARDWLLISCYTGQRFSDFMAFNPDKIRLVEDKPCIAFVQKKTSKMVLLPLHPTVLKILELNKGNFPPALDISTYNEQMRQVALMAGITQEVTAMKRSAHRGYLSKTNKWQALSSHVGRRSFATNFYGRIPTPLLMSATGHSTEQMFLRYINPFDTWRVAELGRHFDRMHSEQGLQPVHNSFYSIFS